jgi:hypothetical protein
MIGHELKRIQFNPMDIDRFVQYPHERFKVGVLAKDRRGASERSLHLQVQPNFLLCCRNQPSNTAKLLTSNHIFLN